MSTVVMEERLRNLLIAAIDMVKFAEAKNGSIITLAGAIAIGSVTILLSDHSPHGIAGAYLALVVMACLGSLVLALLSFVPQTELPWLQRRGPRQTADNVVFFGHIQKFTAKEYFSSLLAAVGDLPRSPLPIEEAFAAQIIINCRIASQKFTYFRYGIWCLLGGILTPIGALIAFLVLHEQRDRQHASPVIHR